MPPLVVSDLDGTLLRPHARLSPFAVESLNRLIAGGLAFSFATARSHQTAYPVMRDVDIRLPVIVYGGVVLADFRTGRSLLTRHVAAGVARDILRQGKERGLAPFLYTDTGAHHVYYETIANEGQRQYLASCAGDPRFQQVPDVMDRAGEPVLETNFIASAEALGPFAEAVSQHYREALSVHFEEDIYTPGAYWLRLAHRDASKQSMLIELARRTGHDLREAIVFGDNLTDLGMFEVAGRAVAVANARPEVKARAHEIIPCNDEDAVVKYLLDRFRPAGYSLLGSRIGGATPVCGGGDGPDGTG